MFSLLVVLLGGSKTVYAQEIFDEQNDLEKDISVADTEVIASMNELLSEAMNNNRVYDFDSVIM